MDGASPRLHNRGRSEAAMNRTHIARFCAPAVLAALLVLAAGPAHAIQLYLPGSTSQLVVDDLNLGSSNDLDVDAAGNLLVSEGLSGIVKVTTGGVETPFSAATGDELVLTPLGRS